MKGSPEVLQVLNDVLCAELTAINQYFVHARMCQTWRYRRLAKAMREESIGEMKHAEQLMDRILYLDGVPNMQKYMKINVGQSVPEMHQFDLDLERDAVARLNAGLELCRGQNDNGSRLLLESILEEEEDHIDWLEAQLLQIQTMGIQNYLAQQIDE
jgi:bacterioferritin